MAFCKGFIKFWYKWVVLNSRRVTFGRPEGDSLLGWGSGSCSPRKLWILHSHEYTFLHSEEHFEAVLLYIQSNLYERPPPVGDHLSSATASQGTILYLSEITIFVTTRRSPPLVEDHDHFLRAWTANFSVILPVMSDHLEDHAICWTKDSKHGFIFTI